MTDSMPSTAPGAFGSTTGFGVSQAAPPTPLRAAGEGSAFDMCHGGVVLRAVLFAQGVLAIGLLFGASGFEQ